MFHYEPAYEKIINNEVCGAQSSIHTNIVKLVILFLLIHNITTAQYHPLEAARKCEAVINTRRPVCMYTGTVQVRLIRIAGRSHGARSRQQAAPAAPPAGCTLSSAACREGHIVD